MKTKFFEIADWRIAEWQEVYAPLNVMRELQAIAQWLEANPRRQRKDYSQMIAEWLGRESAKVTVAQVNARAFVRRAS